MNGQADVVGVLDRHIASCRRAGIAEVGQLAEVIAARAAVVELVEADREYDEARSQFRNCSSIAHRMRLRRAEDRRAAALAAVTPAEGEGE